MFEKMVHALLTYFITLIWLIAWWFVDYTYEFAMLILAMMLLSINWLQVLEDVVVPSFKLFKEERSNKVKFKSYSHNKTYEENRNE